LSRVLGYWKINPMRFIPLVLFCLLISCKKKEVQTVLINDVPKLKSIQLASQGEFKKGSLIFIEPYLVSKNYGSEEVFYLTLKQYFDFAKEKGKISVDRTLVRLPRHIGTWLIFSGEDRSLFDEDTMGSYYKKILNENFASFLWIYMYNKSYAKNEFVETIYQMKAWQMAYKYQSIFSRLAREYRVSIIAGSIVLPNPKVIEGNITPTEGPLKNVNFYFHSDGRVDERISNWSDDLSFIYEGNPFPIFAKQKLGEGKIICFFY